MRSTIPGVFWECIGIAALVNLGIAQPLYNLLSSNVEFFIARSNKPLDIVLLVLILSFLLPLLLLILIFTFRKVNLKTGRAVYAGITIVLTALVLIPFLKRLEIFDGFLLIATVLILSSVILLSAKQFPTLKLFFKYLSLAVIAIPVVFLTNQSVRKFFNSETPVKFTSEKVSSKTPVIVLVLDELPLFSLLDKAGKIDEIRFPNFARFQRNSIWFRNASTVGDETYEAVSAILSGKYPDASRLPILKDYPQNLFTMLAGSYDLKVIEPITKLCPSNLNFAGKEEPDLLERMKRLLYDLTAVYFHIVIPEKYASRLPSVKQTWNDFWDQVRSKNILVRPNNSYAHREEQFKKFLELLRPSDKPSLYFLHILLPHVPWEFLPSGKQYNYRGFGPMGVEGVSTIDETWAEDHWVIRRAYQRHILQLGYVDRLVGEMIKHLEDMDLYEKALIVITADHGASFRPGEPFRAVTQENHEDIIHVPLFIKLPGKNAETIVDRNIESIDILPTIAEALGIEPAFKMDGRSGLRELRPLKSKKRIFKTIFSKNKYWLEFNSDINAFYPSVNEKIKKLEQGNVDEALLNTTYSQLDQLKVKDLVLSNNSIISVELNDKDSFQRVDLNSKFVPAFIVGTVLFRQQQPQVLLGVWINGIFRGVTRTFSFDANSSAWLKTKLLKSTSKGSGGEVSLEKIQAFGIMVPESSFVQGANDIKIVPLGKQENGTMQILK